MKEQVNERMRERERGWWYVRRENAPSISAASSSGGHTGSSLPFRLRQHLRELRIVLTASFVPAGAAPVPVADGAGGGGGEGELV